MGIKFSAKKFVQITDPDGINALQVLTTQNPKASSLFCILMKYMDDKNCVMVSMALLAKKMNTSRQTTSKAVTYLKKNRYIVVYKVGTTNAYSLNADLVWKSKSGNNRYEAMLDGKVLLSLDEQDADIQENLEIKKQFKVVK